MPYLRFLPSTTLVNRNALRSFSSMPPRNCQRTSGCISVSLLIGRSTVTRGPASRSAGVCSGGSGSPGGGGGGGGVGVVLFFGLVAPSLVNPSPKDLSSSRDGAQRGRGPPVKTATPLP